MSETNLPGPSMTYEIRLTGHVSAERLAEWLEPVVVSADGAAGDIVLRAPVVDQAALYGLLARLRDLGARIISLQQLNGGGA
jgi:hypothetical protein